MPRLHPAPRLSLAACCVALSVIGLLGCSPAPEPEPTPTPAFASEEEAFAAAEETYRAYNEALNAVDPARPQTFEPLYALSNGSFEQADRENLSTMHAEGQTITGDARIISFAGDTTNPSFTTAIAIVCLDVSDVVVADADGTSVVQPDRPNVYGIEVHFQLVDDVMLIHSAQRAKEQRCAQSSL